MLVSPLRLKKSSGVFLGLALVFLGASEPKTLFPASSSQVKAWLAQGGELFRKGEFRRSIETFKKCLGDPGLSARERFEAYGCLGVLFWNLDEFRESEANLRRALQIASASGLREEASKAGAMIEIQGLYIQAVGLNGKRDYAGSNRLFDAALGKAGLISSRAHEAKILRTWSFNYLGSSEFPKKYLELNSRSLDISLSLNDMVEACRASYNIGAYYAMISDYSHALSYFLKALSYVKDRTPDNDSIRCLNNIAVAYTSLGDFIKAQDYISEALKSIGPGAPDAFRSSLLINSGEILHAQARFLQAPEYDARALECFTSYLSLAGQAGGEGFRVHALAGLADVYIDQGRLADARAILIPALKQARSLTSPELQLMILLGLGRMSLQSGRLPEARASYDEALAVATTDHDLLSMIRASTGLGRCAERGGDSGQAIAAYGEAINLISVEGSRIADDTHRAEFIAMSREPFQALIDLFYSLSRTDHSGTFEREIFGTAEKCRARSFMEQLERQARRDDSRPQAGAEAPGEALEAERLQLLKSLSSGGHTEADNSALQARIKHLDDLLDAGVFDEHLRSGPAEVRTAPVSLNVIQNSLLTGRTALLEYFLGDERSYVMCVTRDSFHVVALPPAGPIADSLEAYLSFLEDPAIPAAKGLPAARRLYRELVSPVESFLSGRIDQLIVVPDGALFRLPFETLTLPAGDRPLPVNLNDRYIISYSPSASALLFLQKKTKLSYAKDVLAFGVSEYPTVGGLQGKGDTKSATAILDDIYRRNGFVLASIPHAKQEIKNLAARVVPSRRDVYYGLQATEAALKSMDLTSYRLLHFACHAISDDNYPLRSALVLSPDGTGGEDGFLQVSEMYRMRTNADLVVLSACQTGRGKIVRNEGVMGLQRVFFYMGARSVLSTLWPINDKAGARFMDFFYDSYFHGGASKAEALRSAKRKMAKTAYAHPYYWASYILAGEF